MLRADASRRDGKRRSAGGAPRLATAAQVMAPLTRHGDRRRCVGRPLAVVGTPDPTGRPRRSGDARRRVNATLAEVLSNGRIVVFGQDVAVKGGVYGVTRGLRKRFGGAGCSTRCSTSRRCSVRRSAPRWPDCCRLPEIQYLAYIHNAEDQLRGEAASLAFFSNGQYRNGMVVRVAGLGYQRGFGGHFHNDNSIAVFRDVPGLVVVVPSHPADGTEAAADMCRAGASRRHASACSWSRLRSTTNATCSRVMPPGWRRTSPPLPRGPGPVRQGRDSRLGRGPAAGDVRQRGSHVDARGRATG